MLRLRLITYKIPFKNVRFLAGGSNKDGASDDKTTQISPSESDPKNPIRRTLNILGNDMKKIKNFFVPKESKGDDEISDLITYTEKPSDEFQSHCDVLIIGGGGVGSSCAYWLKKKARRGLNVVVVERDQTFKRASTVLSVGGLRQQFSLPENIQMSLFAADFLRNAKENLGDVDLCFQPFGYLTLASEKSAESLRRMSNLQNDLGARNELLTPDRLKAKFPWISTDGIALGCHGLEKEGWFDPWALLMGFKNKAREFGAHYQTGEVVGFNFKDQSDVIQTTKGVERMDGLDSAVIKLPNGETKSITFAICILAAGYNSGKIARLAKIGTGDGILRVPLPVEPRKRYVYVFNTQADNAPGFGTPLTLDPDGTYFRRDGLGGNYICGRSPSPESEPKCDDFEVDHSFFENDIWPTLALRVPAFESAKVCSSWAGYYEYNTYDENGIIGPHPFYGNLFIATGFSGHGIQQTPAVGRAISEMILDSRFRTIDLTRLGFDRLVVDQPMFETQIY